MEDVCASGLLRRMLGLTSLVGDFPQRAFLFTETARLPALPSSPSSRWRKLSGPDTVLSKFEMECHHQELLCRQRGLARCSHEVGRLQDARSFRDKHLTANTGAQPFTRYGNRQGHPLTFQRYPTAHDRRINHAYPPFSTLFAPLRCLAHQFLSTQHPNTSHASPASS